MASVASRIRCPNGEGVNRGENAGIADMVIQLQTNGGSKRRPRNALSTPFHVIVKAHCSTIYKFAWWGILSVSPSFCFILFAAPSAPVAYLSQVITGLMYFFGFCSYGFTLAIRFPTVHPILGHIVGHRVDVSFFFVGESFDTWK